MSTPRTYQTEAVVLRRTEFGEAGRIATFYTPHLGKLKALAKGVRRPKSKLSGHVELFTHSSLLLARGRSLDVVTQGQTINCFLPLKTDLLRSSQAFYVAELIDRFTAEHIENQPLFDLLITTMDRLCQLQNTDLLLRHFEVSLLQFLGYQPNMHRCISCNVLLRPTTNVFSPSGGGILCPACVDTEPMVRPISVDAIKVLRLFQNADYPAATRVKIKRVLATEIEHVLRSYIEYLLEGRIQSATWIDRLRRNETVGYGPARNI
jgi:DNA repair protein RecO (recombination protein O)